MGQYFIGRCLSPVMGTSLLLTACSQPNASDHLAILDSEVSSRAIPDAVTAMSAIVGDSARFLGDHDEKAYFVARNTEDPDHLVCLVQFDPATDEAGAGCSGTLTMTDDKIVALEYGSVAVALVADGPSATYLTDAGWHQAADNLWVKDPATHSN